MSIDLNKLREAAKGWGPPIEIAMVRPSIGSYGQEELEIGAANGVRINVLDAEYALSAVPELLAMLDEQEAGHASEIAIITRAIRGATERREHSDAERIRLITENRRLLKMLDERDKRIAELEEDLAYWEEKSIAQNRMEHLGPDKSESYEEKRLKEKIRRMEMDAEKRRAYFTGDFLWKHPECRCCPGRD